MACLNETAYARENPWTLLELLVMFTNAQVFHLSRDGDAEINEEVSYIGSVPRFKTSGGNDYTIDDIHTFLTDALKLPLEYLMPRLDPRQRPEKFDPHPETVDDVHIINAIAISWNTVKHTWQLCLYHNYEAVESAEAYSFTGDTDQSYFVIARHRDQIETMSEYATYGREALAKAGRSSWRDRKFKRSGLDVIEVGKGTHAPDIESHAVGPFLRENVLPTILDHASQLTVHEILSAWELLAEIAEHQIEEISRARIETTEFSFQAEVRFSACSLSTVLINSLKISPDKAKTALRILSQGRGKANPWSKPLIDLSDGTYMMLAGVLRWANRDFALESILQEQNYNMEARGPALERFTRAELLRGIDACAFGNIAFVSPSSITLKDDDGQEEEIDLILCLGKDLYIVECKAALFPVEVEDDFSLKRKLIAADGQLERKVAFVKARMERIRKLHKSLGGMATTPNIVRGIIVSNFSGGTAPWAKNPIIDPSGLSHYFGAGASVSKIEIDKDGSAKPSGIIVQYYNSFSTFREHFPKYLRYSPHANVFRGFLRREATRFSLSRHGLKDFLVTMPEVVLPKTAGELDKGIEEEYGRFSRYLWS
jgi:hypothetical protein